MHEVKHWTQITLDVDNAETRTLSALNELKAMFTVANRAFALSSIRLPLKPFLLQGGLVTCVVELTASATPWWSVTMLQQ